MASLYKRGNIIWIKYRLPGRSKPIRESLNLPANRRGYQTANIIKREKELEILRGKFSFKEKRLRFYDAFTLFLERKSKETTNLEVYKATKRAVIDYFGTANPYISAIREEQILDFKNWLLKNKTQNTAATYINHLRALFAYLVENKYIEKNPVSKIKSIKMPIVIISKEDLGTIFNHFENRNPLFSKYLNLLYLSGMRRNEALFLQGKHIIPDRKIIQIYNSKEKRWDEFPMIRNLDIYFNNFSVEYEARFFPWKPDYVTKYFARQQKEFKLNIHYTLHDFRRTFGTEMAKTVKPFELKRLMRHKDLKTTLSYYVNESEI